MNDNAKSQLSSLPSFVFQLPSNLEAREPREASGGTSRSDVKLLVVKRDTGEVEHSKFQDLRNFLRKGDLLVFNSSRTLPASLAGRDLETGTKFEVRLAEHLPDDSFLVLLLDERARPLSGKVPHLKPRWIDFGKGLSCFVISPSLQNPLLWKVNFSKSGFELIDAIYELGYPVRYEHIKQPWKLDYYQNVYADKPGSAEMASAGRAFTWKMIFDLKRFGINSVSILLHTGLSSYMDERYDATHPISEEEYNIDPDVARKINLARSNGGRVVAIGTTVVRALESAPENEGGMVRPFHGYTKLHVSSRHKLKVVDCLLTGLHEPQASHLDLLRAFLSEEVLSQAYNEAIERGYLWHEFGDLNLIL